MKNYLFNTCVAIYLLLLLLALGTLSVPPRDLPIYGGMLLVGITAFVLGKEKSRRWRIGCSLAIATAVIGIVLQVLAWAVKTH